MIFEKNLVTPMEILTLRALKVCARQSKHSPAAKLTGTCITPPSPAVTSNRLRQNSKPPTALRG